MSHLVYVLLIKYTIKECVLYEVSRNPLNI